MFENFFLFFLNSLFFLVWRALHIHLDTPFKLLKSFMSVVQSSNTLGGGNISRACANRPCASGEMSDTPP